MDKIAIAWRRDKKDRFSTIVIKSIKRLGYKPYFLKQVKADFLDYKRRNVSKKHLDLNSNSKEKYCMLNLDASEKLKNCDYSLTNVCKVLKGVKAVVFTGGEDISSTLFSVPKKAENNGENFNAGRDVSDYILMKYCLEHDIKVFAICRGMQMMAVVSGSVIAQDLEGFYKEKGLTYDFTHRIKGGGKFTYHGINFKKDSLAYSLFDKEFENGYIDGIPSWHHQAVIQCPKNVTISGVHNTLGEDIIEAIELENKTFALGVQFHIEEIIYEKIKKQHAHETTYKICESFFKNVLINLTK
ncbi:MAG: gamma-glutamyl-gamma-aminobutyrate hydrolase family protein [Firmicutes bacterium]|nr:gamma-glutamyl-gamma-aminobutyrate hydrolase family protein [Candidatus Caballimonas caccae]